ncbi:hypothetical protein FRACYDRAFT_239051 [Fragilariopsis cylindrus CCMP1102]|uniref:Uncharacterized protein n=1 Tax=Fragilariopsis cylindrus CCMP1102 TaxID=635003 RepID=A0A1E7FE68_9STRA|nr:hypothetical protein FRACYDRAFT_239051 [Fragilariopsis cylindrus CCMP1102]|eukprot:OEU16459.1 hypothetical protein FRACYDRAFT_239051 [Fragilariopsis cylindrus CCMP1102]
MKGWKMKLIRWQKVGKRSSSTAVASPINNNNVNINNKLNSCLKSSLLDSDDSISMRSGSKESSSSVFVSSGDDSSSSSVSADASSRHSIPSSNNVADTDDHDPIAGSANSCTSNSANTTCGSSNSSNKSRTRKKKIVRFDVVQIRKYERTISDNPCCSSGPPIGIGWKHGDIKIINIHEYEQSREYGRVTNLGMVLTREEREQLLMYWGVPIPLIAGSTRAASKAKHQRRQTVINTRKMFKLEKAMELASRKLKRALLIRSSSTTTTKKHATGTIDENNTDDDDDDDRLEEEGIIPESMAHLVSKSNNTLLLENDHRTAEDTMTASSYSLDDNENKETEQIHNIHVTEPDDDIIGKMDMSVKTGVTGKDANEVDKDVKDDDDYTLGATTLGNNSAYTTPSTIEMENFYRELELELFGDETELPSFVGQTLEVPLSKFTNTSSSNANANNNGMVMKEDTSYHSGTSNSNPQSAFVEKYRGVGPTPVFAADDEYRNCLCNYSPMYYNTNSAQQQHQQQQEIARTINYQHNNNYHNEVGEDDYNCHPFPNHPPQAGRYEPTHHSPVDSNITNNQRYHGHSFESAGSNNDLNTHTTQNRSMYGDPHPQRMISYPRSGIYEPMHRPMNNNGNNYRRRNGSFDDSTYNQTTTKNQFLQSSSHEAPMNENDYYNYRRRNGSFDDCTYNQTTTENQQSRHSPLDEIVLGLYK